MDRVLKSIDQLASMLTKKLKESEDHKPLDQILKELSKYASTWRGGISNGSIYRSLEKEDEKIKDTQQRALVIRVANNSVDAGELVSSCQATKDALESRYILRKLLMFFFSNYGFIDLSLGWARFISNLPTRNRNGKPQSNYVHQ